MKTYRGIALRPSGAGFDFTIGLCGYGADDEAEAREIIEDVLTREAFDHRGVFVAPLDGELSNDPLAFEIGGKRYLVDAEDVDERRRAARLLIDALLGPAS